MTVHSLRLGPGEDLKERLTAIARERGLDAGFVVTCVGSLTRASIRFAGRPDYSAVEGPLEIVGLVGTFGPDGAHLHITVGDRDGRTTAGHLGRGAIIRTTAEVVLGDDTARVFRRKPDAATGYHELAIEERDRRAPPKPATAEPERPKGS